jgi:uncharacterized membrane protein
MTDEATHPEACEACRIIDRADGVEDGKLYRSFAPDPRTDHRLRRGVEHAQHRAADAISGFAGSIPFIYIHVVWFVLWIAINLGALGRARKFDPFPFGLLTLIVSLEAIFLSTFILITQNRQEARSELRAEFDFRNNVRGEIWAAHIGQALGLDAHHVEDVVRRTVQSYVKEAEAQEE